MEWISVKDRLPRRGSCDCYLVCVDWGDGIDNNYEIIIDQWLGQEFYSNIELNITHWMKLPTEPKDIPC